MESGVYNWTVECKNNDVRLLYVARREYAVLLAMGEANDVAAKRKLTKSHTLRCMITRVEIGEVGGQTESIRRMT